VDIFCLYGQHREDVTEEERGRQRQQERQRVRDRVRETDKTDTDRHGENDAGKVVANGHSLDSKLGGL